MTIWDHEIEDFRWFTKDGRRLKSFQMDTDHIYSSLNLLFNNLARKMGVPTVGTVSRYTATDNFGPTSRKKWFHQMNIMCTIIDRRGDLPYEYEKGYSDIKKGMDNPYFVMKILNSR